MNMIMLYIGSNSK